MCWLSIIKIHHYKINVESQHFKSLTLIFFKSKLYCNELVLKTSKSDQRYLGKDYTLLGIRNT